MSMKTIEVQNIIEGGAPARVEYDDKKVTLYWVCGASYTWTDKANLKLALDCFERTAEIPEAVYNDQDDGGRSYWAQLIDNTDFLGNNMNRLERSMGVKWEPFLAALKIAADVDPKPKRRSRAKATLKKKT